MASSNQNNRKGDSGERRARSRRERSAGRSSQRSSQSSAKRSSQRSKRGRRVTEGVFSRSNYMLLLLGIAIITVGYVMMRMENEVDGFISLYIAPVLILGGYLEIIFAIFYKPKEKTESEAPQS